jgi:hypothetical protein
MELNQACGADDAHRRDLASGYAKRRSLRNYFKNLLKLLALP